MAITTGATITSASWSPRVWRTLFALKAQKMWSWFTEQAPFFIRNSRGGSRAKSRAQSCRRGGGNFFPRSLDRDRRYGLFGDHCPLCLYWLLVSSRIGVHFEILILAKSRADLFRPVP